MHCEEGRREIFTRMARMNRGGGGLIRHGWGLFPLTPSFAKAPTYAKALRRTGRRAGRPSPWERENGRQSQSKPMFPVVGGLTVQGQPKAVETAGLAGGFPCAPTGLMPRCQ